MVFTSMNNTSIRCRHYEMNPGQPVNETDVANKSMKYNEIGPSFDLAFRRDKLAGTDLYKAAMKHPKAMSSETKKVKKNVYTDEFGQVHCKVYLQHQDTKTLGLRKFKNKFKGNKKCVKAGPGKNGGGGEQKVQADDV